MNSSKAFELKVLTTPLYPNSIPLFTHTAMRLAQGLVNHPKWESIEDIWQTEIEGRFGMHSIFVELELYSQRLNFEHVRLLDELNFKGHSKGLIEVEVIAAFGRWFGEFVLGHRRAPVAYETDKVISDLIANYRSKQ